MHENYIKDGETLDNCAVGGKDDLLRAITGKFLYDESLTLRIVAA